MLGALFDPVDLELVQGIKREVLAEELRVPGVSGSILGEAHAHAHGVLKEMRAVGAIGRGKHGVVHDGVAIERPEVFMQQVIKAVAFSDCKEGCIRAKREHMRRQGPLLTVVFLPKIWEQEAEGIVGMHVPVTGSVSDGLAATHVSTVT